MFGCLLFINFAYAKEGCDVGKEVASILRRALPSVVDVTAAMLECFG